MFSVHVASTTDSFHVWLPVASITTSFLSPQTVQVWVPFPAFPHVAAVSTTTSPYEWAAGIAL